MTLSVKRGRSDVAALGQGKESAMALFLTEIMRRRKRLPTRLAADLGVSHPTIFRWLSGADLPGISSCRKLVEYSSVPPERVLAMAGHLPKLARTVPDQWPEFREYAHGKYPDMLDEDLISVIEELIERRRTERQQRWGLGSGFPSYRPGRRSAFAQSRWALPRVLVRLVGDASTLLRGGRVKRSLLLLLANVHTLPSHRIGQVCSSESAAWRMDCPPLGGNVGRGGV